MKNVLTTIIVLLLAGCGEAEATSNKNITSSIIKPSTVTKTVGTFKYTNVDPVEINLDDMLFVEAFRMEHHAKGEGHTFWWKGNEYTTDLAVIDEFVIHHVNQGITHLNWVLNNDDPDDNCRSNRLDDCGVCDGPGKTTWFRDKDGDGLGTFAEWITSCTFPTDTEIEKFYEESLQDYGGDQGVIGE